MYRLKSERGAATGQEAAARHRRNKMHWHRLFSDQGFFFLFFFQFFFFYHRLPLLLNRIMHTTTLLRRYCCALFFYLFFTHNRARAEHAACPTRNFCTDRTCVCVPTRCVFIHAGTSASPGRYNTILYTGVQ